MGSDKWGWGGQQRIAGHLFLLGTLDLLMVVSHTSLVIVYPTLAYSVQLQGMDDPAPFLFHYTSVFVCLLLERWGDSRTNSFPHSSMPFDTFTNKDSLFFFPKSISKDLKRQLQSKKLKLENLPTVCITQAVFSLRYFTENMTYVLLFLLTLDSMCVKI